MDLIQTWVVDLKIPFQKKAYVMKFLYRHLLYQWLRYNLKSMQVKSFQKFYYPFPSKWPKVKLYSMQHPEMFWIAFIMTFILLIVLACCEGVRRRFPANFICLFLFTFFESFLLGSAASRYDTEAVMIAVAICTVVCLGLTLFAFQTKIDFTLCSGFLMVAVLILVCFGFVAMFFPGRIIQLVYASLGAIIFSLYLVFDTQLMIGGKHKYSLSPEEYIFASLNIYLDVINIFLSILQIVGYVRD